MRFKVVNLLAKVSWCGVLELVGGVLGLVWSGGG